MGIAHRKIVSTTIRIGQQGQMFLFLCLGSQLSLATDPSLASYTGIRESAQQTASVSSGYHTYTVGAQPREVYWTTISAYGQEWRLALNHAIN